MATRKPKPWADTMPADLIEHLADTGNQALQQHWHTQLCDNAHQPADCPANGWEIGESLTIVLPAVIAAYENARAVKETH